MYKFIILGIKINKLIFLCFQNLDQISMVLINLLLIKPMMHVKYKNLVIPLW